MLNGGRRESIHNTRSVYTEMLKNHFFFTSNPLFIKKNVLLILQIKETA